jgi:hypothetical protein
VYPANVFVDSGADGSFIDANFTRRHSIPTVLLPKPISLLLADGRPAPAAAMKAWIAKNLKNKFIRKSASPFGAPCFFVKKKSGDLRLCMDYRALNRITRKDRNPLPLISDLLRTLGTGKFFTALDLRGAYNLLRVKEGDES